jgi:hypothetical protein
LSHSHIFEFAYPLQRTRWMQQTRPLPDCHPELSVTEWPSFREYRVENWRLARDGSGNVVRGATSWGWIDLCLPVVISFIWPRVSIPLEVVQFKSWKLTVSKFCSFAAAPCCVHSLFWWLGSPCTAAARKSFMVYSKKLYLYISHFPNRICASISSLRYSARDASGIPFAKATFRV